MSAKNGKVVVSLASLVTTAKASKAQDGVGAFVREMLVEAMIDGREVSTKDVLAAVKEKFAGAKTTTGCVAWYRSELRNNEAKLAEVAKKVCERRGIELS